MNTYHTLINADCHSWLLDQPDDSVDLVFGSPPYEDARLPSCNLRGQEWVDWLLPIAVECCRVSRGLVCFVVEGRTKNFAWSATPVLLMASLHNNHHLFAADSKSSYTVHTEPQPYRDFRIHVRKPVIYKRVSISGSGGPDYLRNDYEFIVVFSKRRRLLWSDNTAMGKPPKYKRGGNYSHRKQDGSRLVKGREYPQLKIANPGNVIDIGSAGGGHLGSKYAHQNEAPFPELLPEFFIRTFCPPAKEYRSVSTSANFEKHRDAFGGIVLDPFSGSGTTSKVAAVCGRHSIGIEIRRPQYMLSARRLKAEVGAIGFGRKEMNTRRYKCPIITKSKD